MKKVVKFTLAFLGLVAAGYLYGAVGGAILKEAAGGGDPPEPAPKVRGLVADFRTRRVVNEHCHFHEKPWSADLDPKVWKSKYTGVFFVEAKGAKVGDVVVAHHQIMFVVRGAFDVRFPGKKYPVGCQLNVHCRTLTAVPERTVVDAVPADNEGELGSFHDGPGAEGVWGTSYGEDATAGGNFLDVDLKLPITAARVYYRHEQTTKFTVTKAPLVVAWWAQPKSQGADGTVFVQTPASSNYSEAWVMVYR